MLRTSHFEKGCHMGCQSIDPKAALWHQCAEWHFFLRPSVSFRACHWLCHQASSCAGWEKSWRWRLIIRSWETSCPRRWFYINSIGKGDRLMIESSSSFRVRTGLQDLRHPLKRKCQTLPNSKTYPELSTFGSLRLQLASIEVSHLHLPDRLGLESV